MNKNIKECCNDCLTCDEVYNFPFSYCCIFECGEHEFCRGCEVRKTAEEKNKLAVDKSMTE